jgi:hypothetical protein
MDNQILQDKVVGRITVEFIFDVSQIGRSTTTLFSFGDTIAIRTRARTQVPSLLHFFNYQAGSCPPQRAEG